MSPMPTASVPPSPATQRRRAARILSTLEAAIPFDRVELHHGTPFELLVATVLSAQSTDQQVNEVTPLLFRRWRYPRDYARASQADLEAVIRSVGLSKAKARRLIACGLALTERFDGKVPKTMAQLVSLPGVGRKTANVILGHAFGQPAMIVDTHVQRVAGRLGLARSREPDLIEQELGQLLPLCQWTQGSQRLLLHGRYVCTARAPKCPTCAIYGECHWEGKPRR